MWKREKVQEMLRSVAVLLVIGAVSGGAAHAAIWPEQLGPFARGPISPVALADTAVWEEYGLAASEQAEYISGSRRFTAVAYRFKDPTGAMAAFQWQRPAGATPSKLGQLAVETPDSVILAFHNYLLRLTGWKPDGAELAPLLESLPQIDQSSLPTLPGYMPAADRIPDSERYVLGPASLAQFEPRIPPSVAAFHLGTEAQFARFKAKGDGIGMAVFSYPTPSLARERADAFSKLPGALVKRSGPLVAVILSPSDPDEAERLLAKVQYQATITWNERLPTRKDNVGNLILNILLLTGLLFLFCAAAGVAFGGFRVLARHYLKGWVDEEPVIMLHLEDR
jgi:hypothetical protein